MKKKLFLITFFLTSSVMFGDDTQQRMRQFNFNQFRGDLRKQVFAESTLLYKRMIKKIGKSCNAFEKLSDADQDQVLNYVAETFSILMTDMKTISPKQAQIKGLKFSYILGNIDDLLEKYGQLRQEKKLDTQFGEFFTQAVEKGVEQELGVSLSSLDEISVDDRAKMDDWLLAKLKAQ